MPQQRTCSQCETPLIPHQNAHGRCKRCADAAYRVAHLEEGRAKDREYYQANAEQIKANVRAYAAANREKASATHRRYQQEHRLELNAKALARYHTDPTSQRNRSRKWKAKNRPKLRVQARALYERNRPRYVRYSRKWQMAHPERKSEARQKRIAHYLAKEAEGTHRRRSRLRSAFVAPVDWRAIWERDKGRCQRCGKVVPFEKLGRDHIWPISRGGTHEPRNAQCLCRPCNSRKSNTGWGQPRLFA